MATKRPTAGFDDPFFRASEEVSEIHELGEDELELVEEPAVPAPNPFGESVLDDDDGEWVDEKTRVWQGGDDPAPAPAPAPSAVPAPVAASASPAPAAAAARPASVRVPASSPPPAQSPAFDPMEEERTVITDSSLVGGRVEHHGPARRMTAGSGPVIPVPAAAPAPGGSNTMRLLVALLLIALVLMIGAIAYVFTGSGTPAADSGVTLAIFSEPTGATVFVDGQPYIPEGATSPATTPTTVRGFAPDTDVQIRLERDGFQALDRTIRLGPGERATERYQLQPRTATLIVSTNPAGATVRINDEDRGSAPLTVDDLRPGQRYRVVAARDGFEPAERSVDFSEGAPLEQRVALTLIPVVEDEEVEEVEEIAPAPRPVAQRPAPTPTRAEPRREARPAPAPAPTRQTTSRPAEEPPATERPRAVRERPSAIAQASEAPAPTGRGTISVNARPYGQVWINGRMVASETPLLNHQLSAGTHEVRVFFVDAREFSETRRIQIEPGQNERVVFTRR